jgi:hypothetical protein
MYYSGQKHKPTERRRAFFAQKPQICGKSVFIPDFYGCIFNVKGRWKGGNEKRETEGRNEN